MKSKEEKRKTYLHLCLPLVEVTDNNPHLFEHYEESGIYFVKTLNGSYSISEVNKEDITVCSTRLPINIGNLFEQEKAALAIKEEIDDRLTRLEEVVVSNTKQTEACVEGKSERILRKLEELQKHDKITENALTDIMRAVHEPLDKQNQHPAVPMGFVSQETVVEILRTIK